jgi:hemin uptake protein HemP
MTETPHRPDVPASTEPNPKAEADGLDPRASWRSEDLLGDQTEVLIQHGTEVYRLRRTRQGKLILYK